MSLDTRRARNGALVCRRHDRGKHDKVGGARSARRLARGPALARRRRRRLRQSRAGDATRRAKGAVMSLDTRRTRNGALACRRHDRRTHDKVGGARSARRLARGSALARRASPVSALTEPSRRCNARGAVMSLDTRRTRHESACACVDGATRARTTRSRRRSVGTTTRSRLGARSAGVAGAGSDGAEPAMQRKRRGDVTRHTTHTTRECVYVCRRRDRARTTKPAALGRHNDSLAAQRSLGGRRRCRL